MTPSQYRQLKERATEAGKAPAIRPQVAVEIAKYAVSEMLRIGFTSESLCGFAGYEGFERFRSQSEVVQKKKRGPWLQIGVQVNALSERARLAMEQDRGTGVTIRSPMVRVAFRDEIKAVTATFRQRFEVSRWAGRNIVVRMSIECGLPEAERKEISRRLTEDLREFTLEIQDGEITGGYSAVELLPSGARVPLDQKELEALTNRIWFTVNAAIARASQPQFYEREKHEPARARVASRVERKPGDPSAQNDRATDFGHEFV